MYHQGPVVFTLLQFSEYRGQSELQSFVSQACGRALLTGKSEVYHHLKTKPKKKKKKGKKKFTSPYGHKDRVAKLYYLSPKMCLYSK